MKVTALLVFVIGLLVGGLYWFVGTDPLKEKKETVYWTPTTGPIQCKKLVVTGGTAALLNCTSPASIHEFNVYNTPLLEMPNE